MAALITALVIILVAAWVIDEVMKEDDVRAWRAASRAARNRVTGLDVAQLTVVANERFRGLFDAIYGGSFWSRKRFIRSCLSSLFAIVVIVLIIGIEDTLLIFALEFYDVDGELSLILLSLVVFTNFIGDYLSLQETRWVMGRSQRSKVPGIAFWFAFDLLATTLIFVFFFFAWLFVIAGESFTLEDLVEFLTPGENSFLFAKDGLLPFLLSTYFTSALWLLFVGNALIIRLLSAASPVLAVVFRTIGNAQRPAQATAGFFCGLLVLGYAATMLFTAVRAWAN